ncbi:MAG: hypothetical protein JKY88_05375 [Pseudomonadales bacterium]|nr:hypothetical protein [Pseudomonadales bacterium]
MKRIFTLLILILFVESASAGLFDDIKKISKTVKNITKPSEKQMEEEPAVTNPTSSVEVKLSKGKTKTAQNEETAELAALLEGEAIWTPSTASEKAVVERCPIPDAPYSIFDNPMKTSEEVYQLRKATSAYKKKLDAAVRCTYQNSIVKASKVAGGGGINRVRAIISDLRLDTDHKFSKAETALKHIKREEAEEYAQTWPFYVAVVCLKQGNKFPVSDCFTGDGYLKVVRENGTTEILSETKLKGSIAYIDLKGSEFIEAKLSTKSRIQQAILDNYLTKDASNPRKYKGIRIKRAGSVVTVTPQIDLGRGFTITLSCVERGQDSPVNRKRCFGSRGGSYGDQSEFSLAYSAGNAGRQNRHVSPDDIERYATIRNQSVVFTVGETFRGLYVKKQSSRTSKNDDVELLMIVTDSNGKLLKSERTDRLTFDVGGLFSK